jgi:hypothetical protein
LGPQEIRKRNPGIFRVVAVLEANEIFVTLTSLATVENLGDVRSGVLVWREFKGFGVGVHWEFWRILIGFEERDMKDRMEAGEIVGKVEFVRRVTALA